VATRFTLTPLARQQLDGLRGRRKLAVADFLIQVESRGCAALDYRLTGDGPLERICVKHLDGAWRVVVSFDALEHVWVLLIGPHDRGDPDRDVYTTLYRMLGSTAPTARRRKPACCDDTGLPPVYKEAELLAEHLRALRRGRR
jgi:hypothetical protein